MEFHGGYSHGMDVKFILEIKILKLANSTGTRSEGNWKQYLRKMLAGVNKEY